MILRRLPQSLKDQNYEHDAGARSGPRAVTIGAPLPRWFQLAMVLFLAAAAFCVDFEVQSRIARNAHAEGFDDASMQLVLWGQLVGPLLGACLVAYPLARLYGKDWKLACVGVLLPIALYNGYSFFDADDPFGTFLMLSHPLGFAIALSAAVALAQFAMRGSRLVVVPDDGAAASGTAPLALKIALLPILVIAMFIIRALLDPLVVDIATLPTTKTGDRASMMTAALLAPAALAAAFAWPIARTYGRHALLVGALVPLLCLWWNRWMIDGDHSPYLGLVYAAEFASLLVLPPLAAWWAARWFRGTRLAIGRAP